MSQAFPAFSSDAPDSSPAPAARPVPTLGDIISAHWTLGRQDQAGMPLQAEIDGYGTVTQALDKALPDDRPSFQRWTSDRYFNASTAGLPVQTDRVWQDVARARAANPGFLKDIPATDEASFRKWVQQGQLTRRHSAQDVESRQSGVVAGVAGFGTDLATGFTDPLNVGTMAITGGIGGAAKTLPQIMAREALVNATTEAAQLPTIAGNRADFGEDMTATDMAEDVGMAGVGGAVFPLLGHGAKAGGAAAADVIGRAVDSVAPGYRAAREAARLQLAPITDAEVLGHYEGQVPPEARSPEQQAAVNVLQRQSEVDASRPFVATPAGAQAHADGVNQALDAIEAQLSDNPDAKPRAAPDVPPAAPLHQDNIIRFVINGLEGGPAVVHYGAADGGTTKFGIAAKDNPGVDVANLTEDQAATIAKNKYWFPELDKADPRVAAVAFDAGFISGPKVGRQILEQSGGDVDRALQLYRDHLNNIADTVPGKVKYKKGWSNRVDKLARRIGGVGEDLPVLDPTHFDDADAWREAQDTLDSENLGRSNAPPEASTVTSIGPDDVHAAATDAKGTDMGLAGDFLRAHADLALDAGLPVTLHIGDREIPIVGHGMVDAEGQRWGAMLFLSPGRGEAPRLDIGSADRAPPAPEDRAVPEPAFDTPDAPAALAQADSLEHDVRMEMPEEKPAKADAAEQPALEEKTAAEQPTFRIEEEGDEVTASDVLSAHDEDLAAVERARACMAPPGAAA